jgi:DNA-binding NarL/FixJ family response regulator
MKRIEAPGVSFSLNENVHAWGAMLGAPELTPMSHASNREHDLRVLIVADVKAYRDALVMAMLAHQGVVAFSLTVDSAMTLLTQGPSPDAILVDASGAGGMDLISHFRGQSCDAPVIAFGRTFATSDIMACAEAGAAGYVPADSSIDDLVNAMFAAVSGELVCSPKVAYDLFRSIGSGRTTYTPREHQVLQLLAEGLSNKEIARSLGIAVSTVKNHVHHILEKSDASSRRHVARKSHVSVPGQWDLGATSKDLVPFMLAT